MNFDTQFALALLTACQLQQNQMLKQQNAMLHELMDRVDSVGDLLWKQNRMLKQQNTMLLDLIDRVDSVGDLLWRMDRRHAIPSSPVDKAGMRKRAAKKRHLARKQSAARKRSGK